MNKKKLPKFKSEAEERFFWQEHDSSAYFDWSIAKHVILSNLLTSKKTITKVDEERKHI